MASNDLWAAALAEAESGQGRDPGLWARCFAEANGDEGKAKAAYVKAKVEASNPITKMGYCPSCASIVPMDAASCMCGANFMGSGWKPTEFKPKALPYGSNRVDDTQLVKTAKSRGIYIILAIFFGMIGIHNFYAGRYGRGAAQLVITAVLGWFVIGLVITALWCLVDMFTVTTDGDGHRMS